MNATFHAESLRDALARVARVVPRRTPKPILLNVRLACPEDPDVGATLDATDLELAVRVPVPGCKVDRPGVAVLEPNRLAAILDKSRAEEVALEVEEDKATIRFGRTRLTVAAEDPDLFPEVDFGDPRSPRLALPAASLARAVARTCFACDPDSTRYALGGAKFGAIHDKAAGVSWFPGSGPAAVAMVCTDGRRLAAQLLTDLEPEEGAELPGPAAGVVPARALRQAAAYAAAAAGKARFAWLDHGRGWLCDVDGCRLYTRLVEGRFPEWRDVLPSGPPVLTAREPSPIRLSALAEQAAICADDADSAGVVHLELHPGRLLAHAAGPDRGEARAWRDDPGSVAGEGAWSLVHPQYLREALAAFGPEEPLALEWRGKTAALVLRGADYVHIIMPATPEPHARPAEPAVRAALGFGEGEVAA